MLDGFCASKQIRQIDVLKIDTEGHDLAVLEVASGLLAAEALRFVYVEFNSLFPTEGTSGGALMPIGSILQPLGFRFVATYPEQVMTSRGLFVTSNALFVHPDLR